MPYGTPTILKNTWIANSTVGIVNSFRVQTFKRSRVEFASKFLKWRFAQYKAQYFLRGISHQNNLKMTNKDITPLRMPSGKQSVLSKDALQQQQSPPIDVIDEARDVYSHLRTLGLPASVTFEGFLSVYTLGLGRSESHTEGKVDDLQTDAHSSRSGVVKERNLGRTKSIVRSKSRVRVDKETNDRTGKWKETLDMVAQRLVGRSEAARVRASISAATSNGEAHFEDPMKIANDRRESLYRVLGSVQKEWEIENKQLMDLDRRKKKLESEIEHKRKVLLLLDVLEKREGFRMKRIGSVGNEGEGCDDRNAGIGDLIKKSR